MDCIKCGHFYYNNDGSGDCDAPYKESCLRAHHIFHTDPIEFLEENFNIKLSLWQKIILRHNWRKKK